MSDQQQEKQSKLRRATRKLPIVGQYQDDKQDKNKQDSWFSTQHPDGFLDQEPTVLEYFKSLTPSKQDVFKYVADTFPFVRWICNYNLQWFLGDLIAGVTVGAVVIPQGMAYSKLADLPVQYGLYTSFVGAVCYWIFGSSKDVNIGPVAIASIITGAILADVANEHPAESKEVLAGTIAMMAGGIMTVLGLLRLGWLVDLISLPAVSAFITGSAITICFGQIPGMMGMRGISGRDPAFVIGLNILKHLEKVRIDAAFGLSALVLLYLMKWTTAWVAKKRPSLSTVMFFASTLRTVITLSLFTLVSYLINRNRKETPFIRILGFIPKGFHTATPPTIEHKVLTSLLSQTPAAVIVLIIEHISIAKSFGRINSYTINPNSEILAIGVTNLIGPLVGAYAATGSFSRSAINSKAGSRTPMAGVFTAILVLLALYTLTGVFFFVPRCVLAAVIIHAIGDLITPPAVLYEFWKISPLDLLIFAIGLSMTIFYSLEQGIFATIILSLVVLVFRVFHAHGSFLGKVKVRTVKHENEKWSPASKTIGNIDSSRNVFLPLDRNDGSNPNVEIERPEPGIFIYRFSEGFNFPNANSQLDYMEETIKKETRPTVERVFDKPGDRPWNDYTPRREKSAVVDDNRPILKAIILDFSAVNNVDLTSIQTLVDVRKQIDKHAAPHSVQWHFACINSRWSKRALAAAGFGFPSFQTEDGEPEHFKSIYSLAEMQVADEFATDTSKTKHMSVMKNDDVEMGDFTASSEKAILSRNQDAEKSAGATIDEPPSKMAALHGINRPFFHPDVQSALVSALATEELRIAIEEEEEVERAFSEARSAMFEAQKAEESRVEDSKSK